MTILSLKFLAYGLFVYAALRLSYFVFKRFISRSSLDNIPGPPSQSFFTGSLQDVFNFDGWAFHRSLAQKYGNAVRIKGALGENVLYVFDPLAMHHIFLKDQNAYEPMPSDLQAFNVFFGPGLLGTWGDPHRKQKKMLTPVFSAAHMRDMVPLFYNIGQKLENAFAQRVRDGPREIDLSSWSGRTALELIAQSALGTSFDPLIEDTTPHPYAVAAKRLIIVLTKANLFQIYILPILLKIKSAKFRRTLLEISPFEVLQEAKDISYLMHDTSVKIHQSKLKALSGGDEAFKNHIAEGKDLISMLMKNNLSASKSENLPEDEIIGQMSTLTFAGTDTTSSAIARTLWLLSDRQDIQDKLREEVRQAMSGKNALSYDELNGLKYLDSVCRELLRLYAPVSLMRRIAREDTILPLSTPLTGINGQVMHEVLVPKNTAILISVFNHNRNPDLWGPDAEEFKPERWANLPESLTNARVPGVYSNLMTFGGGARACIGFKFSQLEMKVILSLLISKFKFSLSKDKEIFWNMTNITSPCVVGDLSSAPPRLPLIVEEAK